MPGGFGQSKGRATVYFSLVSPLDQNCDPKLHPCIHLKSYYHHISFVINLESVQNSLFFLQKKNNERQGLVLRHRSSRVPRRDPLTSEMAQKGS